MVAMPSGDPCRPALRDQVIGAWTPMARRLAFRYHGRGEPFEDLAQTAVIGLIKAVDKFDPELGHGFVGYAIPTILGEIKRHFRDRTWALRVPRRLQELQLRIVEANSVLPHLLGRPALVADIADYLNVTDQAVIEALEGARAHHTTSFSTPYGAAGTGELGDICGADDPGYALVEGRLTLETALDQLDERDLRIVVLRFHGNLPQSQIAGLMGISQMQVSRLLARALAKLRRRIEAA
ncbi:sigma-70 family RNA polymerase sigma factor [Actinoplanes sp. CA-015351]|uniref:sigma-70 family RNA polymerase sigma factor n=1 Tax=Actinoplanes sp. CA-015351 TaxID=3239897 RepID=UPI003D9575B0